MSMARKRIAKWNRGTIKGSLTKPYREMVFSLSKRFGWRCWYCGSGLTPESASVDHIIPVSSGGSDDFWNLALACTFCQHAKMAYPIEIFLEWLERVRSGETLYHP
jgi:5-methylcytosine-specific restriction endonuclease McrA